MRDGNRPSIVDHSSHKAELYPLYDVNGRKHMLCLISEVSRAHLVQNYKHGGVFPFPILFNLNRSASVTHLLKLYR